MIPLGVLASANVPAAGGGGPLSVTYLQETSVGNNASSYTFTSQPIGTAAADRQIVVAISVRKTAPAATVTSVTIGGVSATVDVEQSDTGGGSTAAIARAAVPSGTTADVVVTLSDTVLRCGIGMWSIDRAPSAVDSATGITTATVDGPDGGAVFAVSNVANSTAGAHPTWSGVTGRYSAQVGAEAFTHSGGDALTTGSSVTVTTTASVDTVRALAVVSYA